MKKRRFEAELLTRHKDGAFEVPFDPAHEWKIAARPLWRGRRGFLVSGTINGINFESAIVPRQKKFYLLIDRDLKKSSRLSDGARALIVIGPLL